MQYLRIIGRLMANGQLRLRPSYLTASAPWTDREGEGDSTLVVELVDGRGEVLSRCPLRSSLPCTYGSTPTSAAVRGWVPFHPETRVVRITNRGRVAFEIRRADRAPEVRLRWRPAERLEGSHDIQWEVRADAATPQCWLRYSHDDGRTWRRVGWRTEGREATVNFDELPGGERCRIAVVTTDGVNTTTVESESFAVARKPCVAFILTPVDGSVMAVGEPVSCVGQGFWLEENRVERERLRWVSSLDGDLGRGAHLSAADLREGRHRLSLVAGERDREGSTSVTIEVQPRKEPDAPASA